MTHRWTWLLLLLLVGACGRTEEEGRPAPDPSSDWLEVPLTENTFWEFDGGFSRDTLQVHVPPGEGVEVAVAMEEGEAIVYTWAAEGLSDPDHLLVEFHGHTDREPGEQGTLMFYRRATGAEEHGALVAPFTGVHGWYFRNDSSSPVEVVITVAGYYRRVE